MASSQAASGLPVAFCTLLTNDNYVDAALTLAVSLERTGTTVTRAIIVTPQVTEEAQSKLRHFYQEIIPVATISGLTADNLQLIGRPELGTTLTKLNLWSLTQFRRVVYLDADTLILQNVDHLFDLPDDVAFAASPELGFPDCFNAGMMVLKPSKKTFEELVELSKVEDSFDGGDQGILNVFFGDGSFGHPARAALHGGDVAANLPSHTHKPALERPWFRLSYLYNIEMHRVYRMYISAVLRYSSEHRILHFIGKDKPWHFENGVVGDDDGSHYSKFYADMVGKWWVCWNEAKKRLETI